MEVFDPAGARIAANSDVTQKASTGGNYLVVVGPSTSLTETGAYSVAFQRPNNPCSPVSLTCGQTTLRQVNSARTARHLYLQRHGRRPDYHPPGLALRRLFPLRRDVRLRRHAAHHQFQRPAAHARLPADGVYTLLVRDRSALNLGSYRVSLQDDTNTCPVNDTEAPVITLVRPTGGEVLPGGTTFRIQWQSDDNVGVAAHDIALSTDGGKTFADPIASSAATPSPTIGSCPPTSRPAAPRSCASPPPMPPAMRNPPPATC